MKPPSGLDVVRVVALSVPTRTFDGSQAVARPPRVGDVGTVVHVHDTTHVVVECVDADGSTLWLADFETTELEFEVTSAVHPERARFAIGRHLGFTVVKGVHEFRGRACVSTSQGIR